MQTQVKSMGKQSGNQTSKKIFYKRPMQKINDMLEVKVSDGMIMLVKTFRHTKNQKKELEKFGGKLNLDGEYEWDKPEGREVW